jgi:uncharacterized protein YjaG (DUF416 family)
MISTKESRLIHLLVIFLPALLFVPTYQYFYAYAQQDEESMEDGKLSNVWEKPTIRDSNLNIDVIARGLDFPNSMAFF